MNSCIEPPPLIDIFLSVLRTTF